MKVAWEVNFTVIDRAETFLSRKESNTENLPFVGFATVLINRGHTVIARQQRFGNLVFDHIR